MMFDVLNTIAAVVGYGMVLAIILGALVLGFGRKKEKDIKFKRMSELDSLTLNALQTAIFLSHVQDKDGPRYTPEEALSVSCAIFNLDWMQVVEWCEKNTKTGAQPISFNGFFKWSQDILIDREGSK